MREKARTVTYSVAAGILLVALSSIVIGSAGFVHAPTVISGIAVAAAAEVVPAPPSIAFERAGPEGVWICNKGSINSYVATLVELDGLFGTSYVLRHWIKIVPGDCEWDAYGYDGWHFLVFARVDDDGRLGIIKHSFQSNTRNGLRIKEICVGDFQFSDGKSSVRGYVPPCPSGRIAAEVSVGIGLSEGRSLDMTIRPTNQYPIIAYVDGDPALTAEIEKERRAERAPFVGSWRDQNSVFTFTADGKWESTWDNGKTDTGTWQIRGDILTWSFSTGAIRYRVLERSRDQFSIQATSGDRTIYVARRISR